MLPQEGLLIGLAQLSLTVAGFAALVTVFRSSESKWEPQELVGLYIIIELCFGCTFLTTFPILVSYAVEAQENVWRFSAMVLVTFAVAWYVLMAVRIRKIRQRYGSWGINPLITLLLTIFVIPLIGIEILNAIWLDNFVVYLLHVLFLMLVSGMQFMIMVYNYAAQDDRMGRELAPPITQNSQHDTKSI
jgi:hypothetical protein